MPKAVTAPAMAPYGIFLPDVRERALAALLGVAIGDALGATTEFLTRMEVRQRFGVLREIRGGGWLHLPLGAVTDDTEMSLCIARSLTACGFSPKDIADRFAAWLRTRPRDVGATCRRGIRRYLLEGTLEGSANEADAGNGAVMRVVPVALATLGSVPLLSDWAVAQAHITHNHALSDAACTLVGHLIHLAVLGHSKARLSTLTHDFLGQFPIFQYSDFKGYSSAYVVDTMRTVLHSFFTTSNFEECLVATVNYGGDADTSGAIAGAIAGAYYGLETIPKRWLVALDPKIAKEIRLVAPKLVEMSPAGRSQVDGLPTLQFDATRFTTEVPYCLGRKRSQGIP